MQSGESTMELKGVLNADRIQEGAAEYLVNQSTDCDEDADYLAGVVREMMQRPNNRTSFFSLSPQRQNTKRKRSSTSGVRLLSHFHLYTMRQAIEEKFILDVLKNYVTYEAYFVTVSPFKYGAF